MIAVVAATSHAERMFNVRSIELRPPRATLAAVDEGAEAVRAMAADGKGVVDVLVGATVPPEVALAAIGLVARRAPAVDVMLRCADDAENLLARGRADVAFLRAPLADSSIAEAVVANEARLALVPRAHPLAGRAETALDELRGAEILEPRTGALGVGRPTEHVEELLAHVASGHAVAVVPEGILRGSSPAIVAVALTDAPRSPILLAHRPVVRSAATVTFVDAALDAAR